MARITVSVCDVCREEPVERYELAGAGRRALLDLCKEHAAPLVGLLTKYGSEVKRTEKPRGVPSDRRMTMEEIEALKKKGK